MLTFTAQIGETYREVDFTEGVTVLERSGCRKMDGWEVTEGLIVEKENCGRKVDVAEGKNG